MRQQLLSVLVAYGALSCAPAQRVVAPPVHVAQPALVVAAPAPGPLHVRLALPPARATFDADIALVFDRRMRPLEPIWPTMVDLPLAVSSGGQPLPGAWQWADGQTLQFIPLGALPGATTFEVSAGAAMQSLDGTALDAAFSYSFATPLPALMSSIPADGAHDIEPDTTIALTFNQPVTVAELNRTSTLRLAASTRPIPFDAAWADPSGRTLLVTPRSPLPVGETVSLTIDSSLAAVEGPLPSGREQRMTFDTIRPVEAHFVCDSKRDPDTCPEDSRWSVELSRPVSVRALLANTRVEGGCELYKPSRRGPGDELSSVPVRIKAGGKPCSVTLRKGLRDSRGLIVANERTISFVFGPAAPRLRWGLRGSILEPLWLSGHVANFAAQSLTSFDVASVPLSDAEWIATYLASGRGSEDPERLYAEPRPTPGFDFDRLAAHPGARAWHMTPSEALSDRWVQGRPSAELVGKPGERRMVLTRYEGTDGPRTEWRLPQITDLALHASLSPFGSVVWVTRMSDGSSVRDAQVILRRAQGPEQVLGKTGADGILEIPPQAYRPATPFGRMSDDTVLIARKDGDSVIESAIEPRLDPAHRWRSELEPTGLAFTERGLYRRGDIAHVAGFVRLRATTGAVAPPAGTALAVHAEDFDGNRFFEGRATTDVWGRFAIDVPVSGSVRFGRASVRVNLGGPDAPPASRYSSLAYAGFEVGAPRTPVHEATASVEHESYVHGDTAEWTVSGRYLFGSPMGGCDTLYTVTATPTGDAVPLESAYTVDDPYPPDAMGESGSDAVPVSRGRIQLGSAGKATIRVPLTGFSQKRPARVTLHADVQDASRQTVQARATTLLHPAPVYVALEKPSHNAVTPGSTFVARARVIDTHGTALSGYPLRFDLYRRTTTRHERTATREAREEIRDTPAGGCDAKTSAAQASTCVLRLAVAGQYVIRAHTRVAQGAIVAASGALQVERPRPEEMRAAPETQPDDFTWEIKQDKPYAAGQTVDVKVHAPAPVEALVTVSNGGIAYWRRVRFAGDSVVSIPVSSSMAPQSTVRVEAVAGRRAPPDGADLDQSGPRRWFDERSFEVADTRRLKVAVTTTRTDYKPDEQVQVKVLVRGEDGSAQQAALVLYAVDEGELALTRYSTPDPFYSFRNWYGPGVWNRSTLEHLGELVDLTRTSYWSRPPMVRMGATSVGDSDMSLAPPRDRFDPVPYYNATMVTGADGVADASFRLPQQLTSFRIMAVAATRTELAGSGETRVIVHQPLMLRQAMPRFAREADRFEAGVIIAAQESLSGQVQVTVEPQGITVDGPLTKSVTVPLGGDTEVRFPMRAIQQGAATLTFRARSAAASDAVVAKLPIHRPAAIDTVSASGEAKGAAVEPIGQLGQVRADVGGLDVVVSAHPYDQTREAIRSLVEYPYGCAEQRSSSLVGSVVARRWAAVSRLAPVDELIDAERESVAGLVDLQHKDGSFGFWTSSRGHDVWLTGYVLLVIGEMDRQGFKALEGVTRKARKYLEGWLQKTSLDTPEQLAAAAIAIDALSLHGRLDSELVSRLMAEIDRMPPGPAALVAHAVRDEPGARTRAWDALHRIVESHLRVLGSQAAYVQEGERAAVNDLSSDVRTTAMVLRTFSRRPTRDPLTPQLARGLLALRAGATWGSTQRDAWAVIALESARKVVAPPHFPRQARILLGHRELGRYTLTAESPTASARVPMRALTAMHPADVRIESSDGDALPYEVLLRYAAARLPTEAVDRGFAVKKRFYRVVDGRPQSAPVEVGADATMVLELGEFAMMDVIVQARARHGQVVIDDPIPAGLEAVDPGLATSPQYVDDGYPAMRAATSELIDAATFGSEVAGVQPVWTHKEVHPERVLVFVDDMPAGYYRFQTLVRSTSAGTFVEPPTQVEAMYSSSVFGRTATSRVVVATGLGH